VTDYLLIQISDIHLTPDGLLFPGARTRDNLMAALAHLVEADLAPDALLLTGDLANAGEPDCYRDLAQLMDQATEALEGTVVYVPGNHDDRSAFRRHLLGQTAASSPINQTHRIGDLRVISLDSVVVGQEFGALDDETLSFLRDELAIPAPDGTVLALHHPPIASPVKPMAQIMLRTTEGLAQAIDGSDVKLIVSGHNHHEELGALGSVPVWVSPSTAYLMDILSNEEVRGLPGCAVSRIDLTPDGATVTVIPVPLSGV
jgi:3',5'-cyclic AMP phosphodiesterase CpdA